MAYADDLRDRLSPSVEICNTVARLATPLHALQHLSNLPTP
jgi:hypothetical protein